MNVSSILTEKGSAVHTIAPGASLRDAAVTLDEKRVGALVVVSDAGAPCGVISERDVAREVARRGAVALDAKVEHAMTANLVTATLGDSLDALMTRMTDRRVRHLPVIDGERLAGIVSIGDVVKWKIRVAESEAQAMKDYIAAG